MRPRIARVAGRSTVVFVCALALGVLFAPDTGAVGELTYLACFANSGADGCATPARNSLNGSSGVVVSPDGKNVYVVADSPGAITSFTRNPFSGHLTYQGCIANTGLNGCLDPPHDSLATTEWGAVSPNGNSVYATALNGDGVTHFIRSPATGAIAFEGCVANGGLNGCDDPSQDPFDVTTGLAVSPDSKSVYVAASGDSVSHLSRTNASGSIGYQGCLADGGAFGCIDPAHESLNGPNGVAVSRDGDNIYAASFIAFAVTWFHRNPDGLFGFDGCIASAGMNGCDDPPLDSLNGAVNLAVSSDDRNVYVVSSGSDSVTALTRGSGGALSQLGCIANFGTAGCVDPPHDSLENPSGVAVSPDGRSVYATSYGYDAVTHLRRTASTGGLAYQGCVADAGNRGCVDPPQDALDGAWGVAVSPDNKNVYVAALDGLVEFRRHVADCAGKEATLVGTKGADMIKGTPKRDVIAGLGGNDRLRGRGGRDVICGGKGRDRLIGGPGRDVVRQ